MGQNGWQFAWSSTWEDMGGSGPLLYHFTISPVKENFSPSYLHFFLHLHSNFHFQSQESRPTIFIFEEGKEQIQFSF